jgi:hypothetical protein
MTSRLRRVLPVAIFFTIGFAMPLQAYGPDGHEIVGAIADERLANTSTAAKIRILLDGIQLEKASLIPDEIKSWDKKGADDPKAFPHYSRQPKIDEQLRDFWRANQPTHDRNSPNPSHHWFHYADVPVVRVEKYAEGEAGRSKWDVVHMISYCVDVLRGRIPAQNERKITKPVALILLAHYVGDIHQPLHVGAEYFDAQGRIADPDKDKSSLEDEGGNSFTLELSDEPPRGRGIRKKNLHGFWDNDAVTALFPAMPRNLPKSERQAQIDPAKKHLAHELAMQEPKNWRMPSNIDIGSYAEAWANEILPIAREAHERLQFTNVHAQPEEDRIVAAGEAQEKASPDQISYRVWAAAVVREELHKAGWRLADLLQKSLASASVNVTAPPVASEPVAAQSPLAATPLASVAFEGPRVPAHITETPTSAYGAYPSNYKEIVTAWIKTNGIAAVTEQIDWQTEPKPADLTGANGQHVYGYLVMFNTHWANGANLKTHGIFIRDGEVINAAGFGK